MRQRDAKKQGRNKRQKDIEEMSCREQLCCTRSLARILQGHSFFALQVLPSQNFGLWFARSGTTCIMNQAQKSFAHQFPHASIILINHVHAILYCSYYSMISYFPNNSPTDHEKKWLQHTWPRQLPLI